MATPLSSQLGGLNEQLGSFQLGSVSFPDAGTDITLSVTPAITFANAYQANAALALSTSPAITFSLGTVEVSLSFSVTPVITFQASTAIGVSLALTSSPTLSLAEHDPSYDLSLAFSTTPLLALAQETHACVDFPATDSCGVSAPQATDECGCLVDPF